MRIKIEIALENIKNIQVLAPKKNDYVYLTSLLRYLKKI